MSLRERFGCYPASVIPALVLLPGLEGTAHLFEPLLAELDPLPRVTALPYPHNRTMSLGELAERVEDHLRSLGPYVLLGESFSSLVAIKVAAKKPSHIKGLILCGGFATSPVAGWRREMLSFFAPAVLRLPLPMPAVRQWLLGQDASEETCHFVQRTIKRVKPKDHGLASAAGTGH